MSTIIKASLLALVFTVAADAQYGHGHGKFHSGKSTGIAVTSAGRPYASGGWGGFNSTRVPEASGTGYYGGGEGTTTIDVTKTSTTTIVSTVTVKPSPVGSNSQSKAAVQDFSKPAAEGQCGPATVTTTATEKVYITVTPGGDAGVPASSAAPPAKSEGYGKPSGGPAPPALSTPASEKVTSKAPAPPAPSSAVGEYKISSLVQKPVASSAVAVASSAASSAAPKPTSGSGNHYSGTKRGLAYNDASLCKSFGSKFGFGYNWGSVEKNDIGTNYIPMMHGPDKSTPEQWLADVDAAVKKGSTAVMGFNEPDNAGQANLTPEAACSAWKKYMNPISTQYAGKVTIIGPAVSNSGTEGQGLSWLSKFYQVCPDAVVHANNLHFYDIPSEQTVDRFKAHIEKGAALNGKPVWVTEFGLNQGSATPAQSASFLKDCMSYLDGNDKVQGYSYFMVGSGENALNSGSAIGQLYASGM